MSYDEDNEATEKRDLTEKIETLRDIQYEELAEFGEENATGPVYDQQGKFRSGGAVGGVGDNLGDHIATQALKMNDNAIFLDTALQQSIIALALANNYIVPVGGAHDFFVNDLVIPKFGITEFSIESNVDFDMNTNDIFNMGGETINSITEDVTPDGAADFVMTYDASAAILKKVLLDNLPGGGGGGGFSGNLSDLVIDADKSWNDKNITDLLSVGSSAAIVPGSGFIRMGTGEEIRMKNPAGLDDLIITSGLDLLSNQAIIFSVAGGDKLTISEFDIDVKDNDIVNTGDILPGAGSHEVGDFVDFYNQMHSQFFVPEGATIITNRFALAKTGNQLYVNYNDTDADAGFGIFEQGIRHFLFSNPTSSVHELFIGPESFNSGEEYRIQLGANSNASGRIFFIEGIGNDVIIDRAGGSIDQGVQVTVNGLSAQRWLSAETKFFKSLNINSQDIENVGDVFADTFGTSTIGEFQPSNGGFDYILRNRMSWESDVDTYIEMNGTAISIISDDGISLVSQDTMNITVVASTGINFLVAGSTRATIQDNGLVLATGTDLFVNGNDIIDAANIILENGFQITNTSATTTIMDIPAAEFLLINVGGGVRILVEDDILLSCNFGDDLLFQEQGVTVGKYDGGLNDWSFSPSNDFFVDAGGDIILDAAGDIDLVHTDVIDSGSIIPFDDFSDLGTVDLNWDDVYIDTLRLVNGGIEIAEIDTDILGIEINVFDIADDIELQIAGITKLRVNELDIDIEVDLDMNNGAVIDFDTDSATAGTSLGFLLAKKDGVDIKIPYNAVS